MRVEFLLSGQGLLLETAAPALRSSVLLAAVNATMMACIIVKMIGKPFMSRSDQHW